MERKHHRFDFQAASLHYTVFGDGEKVLLCFHGFGLTGESFFELEPHFAKEFTIYNFDLFFHGGSRWENGIEPIPETYISLFIDAFLTSINKKKCSFLVYSIGARLAWLYTQQRPQNVEKIIALAPDGINISPWYKIATETYPGRLLLNYLLQSKNRMGRLIKIGRLLRLAPSSTTRFAESQLTTEWQRNNIYKTWITFRKLKGNISRLSEALNKYDIPVKIYLGSMDRFVTLKKFKKFLSKTTTVEVIVLESGHANIINVLAKKLRLN